MGMVEIKDGDGGERRWGSWKGNMRMVERGDKYDGEWKCGCWRDEDGGERR